MSKQNRGCGGIARQREQGFCELTFAQTEVRGERGTSADCSGQTLSRVSSHEFVFLMTSARIRLWPLYSGEYKWPLKQTGTCNVAK